MSGNNDATDQHSKAIRTNSGIKLGYLIPIDGRRGVRVKQGGKEEDLLPEQIVECITGKSVKKIIYNNR